MRREKARLGVFIHLVYIVIFILYCAQVFGAPGLATDSESGKNPQVLSAYTTETDASRLLNGKELEIFNDVNAERTRLGVSELRINTHLTELARSRAKDMSSKNYYSHRSPDGIYYYQLLNPAYAKLYSCENLGMEFSLDSQRFVNSWLSSNDHKRCLLAPTTREAGYAISEINLGSNSNAQKTYIAVAIYSESQ